jgi:hypothetical protein
MKQKTTNSKPSIIQMFSSINYSKKWVAKFRNNKLKRKSQIYSSGGENISYISQKIPKANSRSKINQELWQVNVKQKIMPFINFKKQIMGKRKLANKDKTSSENEVNFVKKKLSSKSKPGMSESGESTESTDMEKTVIKNFKRINTSQKKNQNMKKSLVFGTNLKKPKDDLIIKSRISSDQGNKHRRSQRIIFKNGSASKKKFFANGSNNSINWANCSLVKNISIEEPLLNKLKAKKRIRKQSVFLSNFGSSNQSKTNSFVFSKKVKSNEKVKFDNKSLMPSINIKRPSIYKNYLKSIKNFSNEQLHNPADKHSIFSLISKKEREDDSYFGIKRLFKKLSKPRSEKNLKDQIMYKEVQALKFFFDYHSQSMKSNLSIDQKLISRKHAIQLIQRFKIFNNLEKSILIQMMPGLKVYHLQANVEFIKEGTLADKVFLVLKGRLQIFSKFKLKSLDADIKLHLTNVDQGICWGQTQILESQILGDHRVSLRVDELIDKLFNKTNQSDRNIHTFLENNSEKIDLIKKQFPFFFGESIHDKNVDTLFCRDQLEKLLKVFVSGRSY